MLPRCPRSLPTTGSLLNEAEYREKLNQLEEELSDVYRRRRALLERFADGHAPVLPPPRYRTDHQARIARCPRCGGSLSDMDGAKI